VAIGLLFKKHQLELENKEYERREPRQRDNPILGLLVSGKALPKDAGRVNTPPLMTNINEHSTWASHSVNLNLMFPRLIPPAMKLIQRT